MKDEQRHLAMMATTLLAYKKAVRILESKKGTEFCRLAHAARHIGIGVVEIARISEELR